MDKRLELRVFFGRFIKNIKGKGKMNIFGKTRVPLFLAAIMLASCNSFRSTPTMSDAEIMETAISTVSTGLAEAPMAIPTNTPISLPTFSLPTITLTPTPTFVPGPTATPIFPLIESFVGIWLNVDSNSDQSQWTKIKITENEDTLHALFQLICYSEELSSLYPDGIVCSDNGASARYGGNPVLMSIDYGSETYNFTVSLNGDTLHVTTFIDYTDNSGIADETHEQKFSKEVHSFPVSEQIVFYHFFVPQHPSPWAVRTPILLLHASSDKPYTSDTAADLRTALELVLQHDRNDWISGDLEIADVTFRDGHADIVLQGEYSGESDEVLNAASMQILLTVFANPAVQSAAVTLNGDTIGNLGVSSSTNAKPADYVYTRAEMETYLREHAYSLEYGEFLDR